MLIRGELESITINDDTTQIVFQDSKHKSIYIEAGTKPLYSATDNKNNYIFLCDAQFGKEYIISTKQLIDTQRLLPIIGDDVLYIINYWNINIFYKNKCTRALIGNTNITMQNLCKYIKYYTNSLVYNYDVSDDILTDVCMAIYSMKMKYTLYSNCKVDIPVSNINEN
jgi:hypothetical protein